MTREPPSNCFASASSPSSAASEKLRPLIHNLNNKHNNNKGRVRKKKSRREQVTNERSKEGTLLPHQSLETHEDDSQQEKLQLSVFQKRETKVGRKRL